MKLCDTSLTRAIHARFREESLVTKQCVIQIYGLLILYILKLTLPVLLAIVSKLKDFSKSLTVAYTEKSGSISQVVQDGDVFSTDRYYGLSSRAISNDLERHSMSDRKPFQLCTVLTVAPRLTRFQH